MLMNALYVALWVVRGLFLQYFWTKTAVTEMLWNVRPQGMEDSKANYCSLDKMNVALLFMTKHWTGGLVFLITFKRSWKFRSIG